MPHALPRLTFAALLLGSLAACASLPPEAGLDGTRAQLAARGLALPERPPALATRLAGQTLSLADAQALALSGHPRLQGLYAELGLSASEVLEAAQFANPRLSASLLDLSSGGQEWTLGLTQPFTQWLLRPLRRRVAAAEFAATQAEVARTIQTFASEVEQAWWQLVAAGQILELRTRSAEAAHLAAELAQRYHAAGNLADLPRTAEGIAAAEAELERLEAQAGVVEARANLQEAMGLPAEAGDWTVPQQLPLPVAEEDAEAALLALAREQRLDLAAARLRRDALEDAAATARRYRWLGDVEVGVERTREADGTRLAGPTLELELPLWHRQQAGVRRAEAEAGRAAAALAESERELAFDLRRHHAQVAAARAAVEVQRRRLLPLQERAVTRLQERVNFMLDSPFELLRQRAEAYGASQRYLETLRDYWLARAALGATVGTVLPSSRSIPAATEGGGSAPAVAADPHAGHGASPAAGSDPHAGHASPPASADPHAGHAAPAEPEDPHAHHHH